jgi:hypothetical protein
MRLAHAGFTLCRDFLSSRDQRDLADIAPRLEMGVRCRRLGEREMMFQRLKHQ